MILKRKSATSNTVKSALHVNQIFMKCHIRFNDNDFWMYMYAQYPAYIMSNIKTHNNKESFKLG